MLFSRAQYSVRACKKWKCTQIAPCLSMMSRDISETGPAAPIQARSQGGANLHNIRDKHADQPTKNRATPHRIHVLPLLNRRRWKQLIFKKQHDVHARCLCCATECIRQLTFKAYRSFYVPPGLLTPRSSHS